MTTVDELLARARARLDRVDPQSAAAEVEAGAVLIDIRSELQRERDGVVPDAPLPFCDGEFELVLCAETLEHVRDVQLLLSEARRVLRPGGTLAITTPAGRGLMRPPDPLSPHLRFFTRRSLARALDELGFDVQSLERRAGSLLVRANR